MDEMVPHEISEALWRQARGIGLAVPSGGWHNLQVGERRALPAWYAEGGANVDLLYLPGLKIGSLKGWEEGRRRALCLTDRVHSASARALRAADVWYLDTAGNAYIRDESVYIDIQGRDGWVDDMARRSTAVRNLFSVRRAQVAMAILSEPTLLAAPMRELAKCSGVAVGTVKGAVDGLQEARLLQRHGDALQIRDPELLFDMWVAEYSGGLGRKYDAFCGQGRVSAADEDVVDGAEISGESAAPEWLCNPKSFMLYMEDPTGRALADVVLKGKWRKDSAGNISIRKKFWTDLPRYGKFGAPVPIVAADLVASKEGRQIEIAGELKRQWLEQFHRM